MSWGHFGTMEDTLALRYTGWQGGRIPSSFGELGLYSSIIRQYQHIECWPKCVTRVISCLTLSDQ